MEGRGAGAQGTNTKRGDPLKDLENLILAIVALLLFPLAIYTGYLGVQAYGEGDLFKEARSYNEQDRRNGDFYRVQGLPEGSFLNPQEYPEITDALQWQVDEEEQQGDQWVPARQALAKNEMPTFSLRGLEVNVSGARVVTPVEEVVREPTGGKRLRIRYRPARAAEVAAYGVYRSGQLVSGKAVRLHVLPLDREEDMLASIAQAGVYKASILGAVALILGILGAVATRLVLRRVRRPKKGVA